MLTGIPPSNKKYDNAESANDLLLNKHKIKIDDVGKDQDRFSG